jgi:hypothetical protein
MLHFFISVGAALAAKTATAIVSCKFHGGFSMIGVQRSVTLGVSAVFLLLSTGFFARGDDAAKTAPAAKPAKSSAAPAAKPKPRLSPELTALRDQVRQQLAAVQKQAFNTRQNSATEILSVCLAFGCNSEVSLESPDGKRINGITCLCWNYPCQGFEMLGSYKQHPAARIGYGYQEHPGEFLAMLAMSRVADSYPIRADGKTCKVADLVEAEKLGCRAGADLSLRLIGLSYYVAEPEWKNDLGETWSIERMIDDELDQPAATASDGGLSRLLGISYAVARQAKSGRPVKGAFLRAQKYIGQCQEYAMRQQNGDGSWGRYFLAVRDADSDAPAELRSTGYVMEWLALSLPEEKLTDPRIIGAVESLLRLVGSQRYQYNAPSLSTQEIGSLGHALHALAIYDQRAFGRFDTSEKQPATAASRTDESQSR